MYNLFKYQNITRQPFYNTKSIRRQGSLYRAQPKSHVNA
jgi:hypothetical protein